MIPVRPNPSDIPRGPSDTNRDTAAKKTLAEIQAEIRSSVESNDANAEAIARFELANLLDGNVPGVSKTDPAGAIKELDRALELFPNWPEALFNRAIARLHWGDFDSSIADFKQAESLFLSQRDFHLGSSPSYLAGVLLGKLLLFRAEARTMRRIGDDLERARIEITQAVAWLVHAPEGVHWLRTVPKRLETAFDSDSDSAQDTFVRRVDLANFGFGFAIVAFAFLLFVLIVLVRGCTTGDDEASSASRISGVPLKVYTDEDAGIWHSHDLQPRHPT